MTPRSPWLGVPRFMLAGATLDVVHGVWTFVQGDLVRSAVDLIFALLLVLVAAMLVRTRVHEAERQAHLRELNRLRFTEGSPDDR